MVTDRLNRRHGGLQRGEVVELESVFAPKRRDPLVSSPIIKVLQDTFIYLGLSGFTTRSEELCFDDLSFARRRRERLPEPPFVFLLGDEIPCRGLAEQRVPRRVGLCELELSTSCSSEGTGERGDTLASTSDLDASHPLHALQSK
jgi:hypothetical protein